MLNPIKSLLTLFFLFLAFAAWSAWKRKGWILEVPLTEKLASRFGVRTVRILIFGFCLIVIVFLLGRVI